MRSFAPISMFSSTLILLWLLLVGISHAQSPSPSPSPADSDAPIEPSLPSYFYTQCESQYSLYTYNDSMVTTTAKMMDWCGCENKLNPQGLAYAGMSIYDEGKYLGGEIYPARTYICAAGTNVTCDSEMDWYNALGNVTAVCGGANENGLNGMAPVGYFYDASRQMAWGFTNAYQINFCELVGWVGIM